MVRCSQSVPRPISAPVTDAANTSSLIARAVGGEITASS